MSAAQVQKTLKEQIMRGFVFYFNTESYSAAQDGFQL